LGRALRLSGISVLALLAGLVLRGQTPSAEAHAWLERSQPNSGEVVQAGPPEILMWFSEEIDVKFSHAQVVNSSGERADNDVAHHGTSNPDHPAVNVPPAPTP
jgi:methionine-rich copper-binding protein CopC